MRKVLQLSKYYPPRFGGIELVAQQISRAHFEFGDEVSVVSFGDKDLDYVGQYREQVCQINTELHLVSTPINFTGIRRILKHISDRKPDLIYVHLPNPFMHEVLRFIDRKSSRIIGIYHSDIVNQKILGRFYDFYFKKTTSRYDEFICSSEELWASSNVLKDIASIKKRIIPFTINELNAPARIRAKFNGKLISIGRLVPYKGFKYLVEAVRDTGYELTIIGDGPERAMLEKIKGSNIKILGKVSDEEKSHYMDEAGLYVLPSINRSEAYGLVIAEAFSIGLPVIASNINSGVTFLVKDGARGLVFPPCDSRSIREQIDNISRNDSLYESLSRSSYDFYNNTLAFKHFKKNIVGEVSL